MRDDIDIGSMWNGCNIKYRITNSAEHNLSQNTVLIAKGNL